MLTIDADALFRAVTATGYKLLAYNLDLRTGEIVSRTLAPNEVALPPEAPSVKALPKMGGDLSAKKEKPLFDDPPEPVAAKPKLFNDDDTKKPTFGGEFWKRDEAKKPGIFGDVKRESGTKKLAEMFSDAPKTPKLDPFSKPVERTAPDAQNAPIPSAANDPYYPRIPAISEETMLEWMRAFAKEIGDPLIRKELAGALYGIKPLIGFERAIRFHQRASQQWERQLRKQALASAGAWLNTLGVEWELKES